MPLDPAPPHPTARQLDAYGRGALDEVEARAVEAHLSGCDECCRTVVAGADDPLVALFRAAASTDADVSAPAVAPAPIPGGYEVLDVIGRGGMGVVYRARRRGLDRVVALKQLAAGADASPAALARFRAEVEAVAALQHPGIVPVFDVGDRDGVPFYVMEYLPGGTLADRLADRPLRPLAAAALLESLARAVDHAHCSGILHRDLKPTNILYDAAGAARVADFGLAKRLDADPALAATRTGAVLGTPSYMAPEQATGDPAAVGPPADVYALGAILFESLTGRPPFRAPSPLETLDLVRSTDPPPPGRLQPGIPRDLQTICLTCLEKDPPRRYPTAAALADDLGRFLRGEPIRARPVGPLARLWKWVRRRPSQASLALTVLVALAALIALGLVSNARLRASAAEADRQRRHADANYRDARRALNEVLGALGDPAVAGNVPRSRLHRAQAEAALRFYDHVLSRTDSTDPLVRHDTALAALDAANLQISLGLGEPAEANLDRAAALLDSLIAADPDAAGYVRDRFHVALKLGVLLSDRAPERALAAQETAHDLAERLRRLEHDSPRSRKDLAWCEHNLGSAWHLSGRTDRAEPHYRRAVAINEQLLAEAPGDHGMAVELAQNLVNLALILGGTDRPAAAESAYDRAATLLEGALAQQPDHFEYVATMADLQVNRGQLDAALGRLDAALDRFAAGLDRIAPLLDAEPDLTRLRTTARNLHGSRAQALMAAGRYDEAIPDWDGVLLYEPATGERTSHGALRLLCLAYAGHHAAVATAAEQLIAAPDALTPTAWYNVGCALAIASTSLAADADITEPDRSAASARLRKRALSAVAHALSASPGLLDLARTDADLDAIADDPAFLHLLGNDPGPATPED